MKILFEKVTDIFHPYNIAAGEVFSKKENTRDDTITRIIPLYNKREHIADAEWVHNNITNTDNYSIKYFMLKLDKDVLDSIYSLSATGISSLCTKLTDVLNDTFKI